MVLHNAHVYKYLCYLWANHYNSMDLFLLDFKIVREKQNMQDRLIHG